MQQIFKPLETEYISIQHVVVRLIRENPLYQPNGINDEPYLVEEARREWGSWHWKPQSKHYNKVGKEDKEVEAQQLHNSNRKSCYGASDSRQSSLISPEYKDFRLYTI